MTMKESVTTVLAAIFTISLATSASAVGVSTGESKKAYFESRIGFPIPYGPVQLLPGPGSPEIHIKKSKKHTVIVVQATLSVPVAAGPIGLGLSAELNGVPMQPTAWSHPHGFAQDCSNGKGQDPGGPATACSVTGTWWLDVDQNLALASRPLSVTLLGGETLGLTSPPSGAVSLAIWQQKN